MRLNENRYEFLPHGLYEPKISMHSLLCYNLALYVKQCGVRSKLYRKPRSYKRFQRQIKKAKSAIVLICSGDDDTYWQDTPGHYVNIWLYWEEDVTVFLAEPGSPENNRSRVPLRYIYDALKSISRFQYLLVKGYLEEDNQWKADGIDEAWNCPEGF